MSDSRSPVAVSIIIAAFNAATTLEDAVGSVRAQAVADWELILVDDGSTDETPALIEQSAAADARIRTLHQANQGTAAARNAGTGMARGEYLVFLDADDMLLPSYLADQLSFASEHPGYDVYACNAELLLPDGRRRPYWSDAHHQAVFCLSAEDQIRESSILLMAVVTRRTLEVTGGFRALHSEDYDFWLRALMGGARHIFNPSVLAVYRRHAGQRTRALVLEAESFDWILRDNAARDGLTDSERAAFRKAIAFSEARVLRRRLEEALLAGDVTGARVHYWSARAAFPNRPQYWLGLAIMLVSPALYARIKRARMV